MASLSNSTVNVPFSADENREMPKILKFKIGLCQLSVTSDKNHNLARARNSIEVAAKKGASLVVLPEMWNCPYSTHYFAKYAEDFDDKNGSLSFSLLSEVAFAHSLTIVGGSMPERRNELLYNTCCVFGPDGNLKAKYSKMHMFDIHIPGDISFKESEVFTAGDQPTIVDTDVGRIGIGICHDIRFPELAMIYRSRGAHLICYPGAFNMSTGELLWELEQRARQVHLCLTNLC
ncbi:Omega-amidase, chloroplastic [Sarracenia purpurea var. burkii]